MADNWKHYFPSELVHHVTAICGPRGEAWLDGLPALIDELSEKWSIKVDEPFAAGEFNFVAPAMSGGEAVVLKVAPPYDDNEFLGEASFLRSREGLGAVRLLDQDVIRRAILIERAVPGKNLAEVFTGNEAGSIQPAVEVLRSIVGPPPADRADLKTIDDWFDGLRRAAGTDFPAVYANKALAIYDRLRATEVFFLHGDFHPANVVSASRSPYLAIDPKGVVGPIGYDIAVFLNNFHWWHETKSDIHDRLERAIGAFSDAFESDPFELREWAYAQMVLGAWWSFEDMPQHYDHRAVAKADIWNV